MKMYPVKDFHAAERPVSQGLEGDSPETGGVDWSEKKK